MKKQRQKEILEIIKDKGYASTNELAKILFSSLPTIRRDLIYLENKGYILRGRGGATLPPTVTTVMPIDFRRISNLKEKQALCLSAQKYLKDFQTIFLDDSTTVLPLLKYIKAFKNIVVITNSLDVAIELRNSEIEFYCTGGKCILSNNFVGRYAEEFIYNFNIDLCLFSSSGIGLDGQINDKNENKGGVIKAMLKSSAKKIYLCDKSKVGSIDKFNIVGLDQIDLIITSASKGSFNVESDKIEYLDE